MAMAATTLAAAVTLSDEIIAVTSATGATVGAPVRIDNEWAVVVKVTGTQIKIRSRGDMGTAAAPHNILAPVAFSDGTAGDLPDLPPSKTSAEYPGAMYDDVVSYGVTGAITPPRKNTLVVLTKATAAAMTLAGPSKADNGIVMTILSQTAAAHTVTYTAGIYGDTTSSDVLTFAAKAGASCTLVAYNGAWGAQALTNVTAA
jgi:hypothetical protein